MTTTRRCGKCSRSILPCSSPSCTMRSPIPTCSRPGPSAPRSTRRPNRLRPSFPLPPWPPNKFFGGNYFWLALPSSFLKWSCWSDEDKPHDADARLLDQTKPRRRPPALEMAEVRATPRHGGDSPLPVLVGGSGRRLARDSFPTVALLSLRGPRGVGRNPRFNHHRLRRPGGPIKAGLDRQRPRKGMSRPDGPGQHPGLSRGEPSLVAVAAPEAKDRGTGGAGF